MGSRIRCFIFYLALSIFFAASLGCAALDSPYPEENEPITPTPSEEAMFEGVAETVVPTNIGASILERLETQDGVPTEHIMEDAPLKVPKKSPADKN